MRRSLIVLAFLASTAGAPAFAQVGIGVGGGADIGVGGSLGGAGAGAGIGAGAGVDTPAGSIGAGTSGGVQGGASVGSPLSVSERNSQAAALGLDLDASRSAGIIGRTVVGANGEVLGKVRGVSTSGVDTVSSVALGSSAASAVALDASKLATNGSGQLVASSVSKADLKSLPASDLGSQTSLVGQAVVGADGKSIGTVQNVVVDGSGSISQVLLKAKGSGRIVAIDRAQLATSDGTLTASNMTSAQFRALSSY